MNNNLLNNLNNIINDSNNDIISSLYNNMSTYQKNIFDNFRNKKDTTPWLVCAFSV